MRTRFNYAAHFTGTIFWLNECCVLNGANETYETYGTNDR
jgi:hypothetical protein